MGVGNSRGVLALLPSATAAWYPEPTEEGR